MVVTEPMTALSGAESGVRDFGSGRFGYAAPIQDALLGDLAAGPIKGYEHRAKPKDRTKHERRGSYFRPVVSFRMIHGDDIAIAFADDSFFDVLSILPGKLRRDCGGATQSNLVLRYVPG
jgi:hypothetical protein